MTEKPKPKSRAELEAALAAATEELASYREVYRAKVRELDQSIEREKQTRDQFADLKQRLATSEADNQRMRGYILRVQEDDVAREELVAIGDPAGEQQLVPKRKPERFDQPSPYTFNLGGQPATDRNYMTASELRQPRPSPKHWLTY